MGFAEGFASGAQVGKLWLDQFDQGALRRRLSDVDKWQVEDIPAGGLTPQDTPAPTQRRNGSLDIYTGEPQTPDNPAPDVGLAPPAQTSSEPPKVVGYRFGGQVFTTKPPKELQDAIRTEQRAIIHGQLGDADKAEIYHQAAINQREKAINNIAERAFSSGSLPAIFNALSTIDDGLDYRYEVGKNGAINVFTNPDGSPDKSTLAKTFANENEALAFARSSLNPKLVSDLASAEQNRAYQRSMMDYNQASLGLRQQELDANAAYRQDGLSLRQQQQADQSNYRQLQELDRKFQYFSNMAGKEPDVQRRAYFLEEADKIQAQMAGIGGQQGLGGDVSATGIYNYLTQEKGISPAHAVGIVTSVDRESGFNPAATHDGNTGYGLMGHRLERRDKLFASAGTNTPNWKQQIDYALTEPEMKSYLSQDFGGDYKAATSAFTSIFEKPANTDAEANTRANYSTRYAGLMGGGSNSGSAPAPRQYAPDSPYYKQAEAMGLAQQEQMRMKNQKPLEFDAWLKLQAAAREYAQGTKGYADMSPEGQSQLTKQIADDLYSGYQATQGGLSSAGAAAPRPSLLDGAKALQEKANGGGNTPTPSEPTTKVPNTGAEAATLAQERFKKTTQDAATKRAQVEKETAASKAESAARYEFGVASTALRDIEYSKDPSRKKALAQEAIDKVKSLYDRLPSADKETAITLMTRLYAYLD